MVRMAWTDVSEVRRVADVTSTDFTDAQLEDIIALSQKEVNSKVTTKVIREPIYFIDNYRQNRIDGINMTYFVKNWKGNWLADANYDNEIDVTDIRVVQYNPNTQIETDITPASVDIENCSFTLSTPVQNVQLFITYAYTPLDPTTPDPFIQLCTTYLAGSYLFVGTDGFTIQFGNVRVTPGKDGGKGKQLFGKYQELLYQLIVNSNGGALSSEMSVRI